MLHDNVINIKVPDKLYLALKKAAEQKSISIAALTRMICSDWVMRQEQDIKGVFTYPEELLEGLTRNERENHLNVVSSGGFSYNQYGEACFNAVDDCEEDAEYADVCTRPKEVREDI